MPALDDGLPDLRSYIQRWLDEAILDQPVPTGAKDFDAPNSHTLTAAKSVRQLNAKCFPAQTTFGVMWLSTVRGLIGHGVLLQGDTNISARPFLAPADMADRGIRQTSPYLLDWTMYLASYRVGHVISCLAFCHKA
ncbi:hypothetical protein AUP68_10608 [Ilyonectria robusta]